MIFPVGGRLLGVKFYTSNTTWTRPENCTSVIVVAIGGGGGGLSINLFGPTYSSGSSGSTTSFGSAVSCGGGAGGTSSGRGAAGSVSTPSNAINIGGAKVFSGSTFLGYGGGGGSVTSGGQPTEANRGGHGGLAICLIKDSLLDSYVVTIGTGGAGGNTGSNAAENGNNGALMVIEFGG